MYNWPNVSMTDVRMINDQPAHVAQPLTPCCWCCCRRSFETEQRKQFPGIDTRLHPMMKSSKKEEEAYKLPTVQFETMTSQKVYITLSIDFAFVFFRLDNTTSAIINYECLLISSRPMSDKYQNLCCHVLLFAHIYSMCHKKQIKTHMGKISHDYPKIMGNYKMPSIRNMAPCLSFYVLCRQGLTNFIIHHVSWCLRNMYRLFP